MRSRILEEAPKLAPVEGVDMAILGSGERLTLIRIVVEPGAVVPMHSHPNEQIGTCVEGEGELTSGGAVVKARPGASWAIPGGEPHEFVAKGSRPVVIVEAWSPPREDYLAMAK